MSRSLEFCKRVMIDPARSDYSDRMFDEMTEIDPIPLFDSTLKGARKICVKYENNEVCSIWLDIDIEFNPDADFEYFTSFSSVHDGTLVFPYKCMQECVMNVIGGNTYNKRDKPPQNGDKICYTVGNLILASEYDKDGTRFVPNDKRWMRERTTVMLPLIATIIRADEKGG